MQLRPRRSDANSVHVPAYQLHAVYLVNGASGLADTGEESMGASRLPRCRPLCSTLSATARGLWLRKPAASRSHNQARSRGRPYRSRASRHAAVLSLRGPPDTYYKIKYDACGMRHRPAGTAARAEVRGDSPIISRTGLITARKVARAKEVFILSVLDDNERGARIHPRDPLLYCRCNLAEAVNPQLRSMERASMTPFPAWVVARHRGPVGAER